MEDEVNETLKAEGQEIIVSEILDDENEHETSDAIVLPPKRPKREKFCEYIPDGKRRTTRAKQTAKCLIKMTQELQKVTGAEVQIDIKYQCVKQYHWKFSSIDSSENTLPTPSQPRPKPSLTIGPRVITYIATGRKIIMDKVFYGVPKMKDFKLVEDKVPALRFGEILCETTWHSVDPYMRRANLKKGEIMPGRCIGTVTQSRNDDYPIGCKVVGNFGWRDKAVYRPEETVDYDNCYRLPDLKGLPLRYALGAVGRVGITAYHGLLTVAELKYGETVVVSGAAGAVGSLVGQIAKLKDCKVVGIAGSEEKCNWLKSIGFDHAINYKDDDIDDKLREAVPEGVDVYFDNVAGVTSFVVMQHMKRRGRVVLCGAISSYNSTTTGASHMVPVDYCNWISKELKVEAFRVSRFKNEKDWMQALCQMRDWVLEGKVKVEETIERGFEAMPSAFIKLFTGETMGKVLVSTAKAVVPSTTVSM